MKSEYVIQMLNAGFTRDEIMAMDTADSTPDPQPAAPAPDPQPAAPAPDPHPAAPNPAPAPAAQSWDALLQEIVSLRTAVQANNRNNAQQPEAPVQDGLAVMSNIIKPQKTK